MKTETRVLVAERDERLAKLIVPCLQEKGFAAQYCLDGTRVFESVLQYRPDLLIMDLLLPGTDGLALLRQITQLPQPPQILVVTAFLSDYTAAMLCQCGVHHILLKPCLPEKVAASAAQLLRGGQKPYANDPAQQLHQIHRLLLELGVNPAHAGYRYLAQATLLAMQNKEPVSVTKTVYPQVAHQCGTTPQRVERLIRFALEVAWRPPVQPHRAVVFETMGLDLQHRPTNARFIRAVAQKLQDQAPCRVAK